jgi:hypothetical protein
VRAGPRSQGESKSRALRDIIFILSCAGVHDRFPGYTYAASEVIRLPEGRSIISTVVKKARGYQYLGYLAGRVALLYTRATTTSSKAPASVG